ncbi:MAG: protein-L-isoaspartate(D-aspartate) O-methyltransferase [Myxococcota bacterium]
MGIPLHHAVIAAAACATALATCEDGAGGAGEQVQPAAEETRRNDGYEDARRRMVERQLRARDITDARVLRAMATVPRHRFVPEGERGAAYEDRPLSIGHDQTISQPYIVALMTQLAQVGEGDDVLEIGTGSGYQAAVLAELGAEVYSIEIVEPLGRQARKRLARLGYDGVHVRVGDGYAGWPEEAPFDAIVVTAAPPAIPDPLREQLAEGGRMVVPVGEAWQELRVLEKKGGELSERRTIPVRFVPMTGRAQEEKD